VGELADGLLFILSGRLAVMVRGASGDRQQIATYGPGAFVGELADLSGRASLITATALDPLSALLVSAEGLHALLIDEVEIGERVIRALILRHLGLTETGCTIIIGAKSSPDVLRLENFLRQSGNSPQTLDPDGDEISRSLIERFKLDNSKLPIVLCPDGQLLCKPTESELAISMGIAGP